MYDGHGGTNCPDFLRDNLHKFIINDDSFPEQPLKAIKSGFRQCDNAFLKTCLNRDKIDISGSCATIIMLVSS